MTSFRTLLVSLALAPLACQAEDPLYPDDGTPSDGEGGMAEQGDPGSGEAGDGADANPDDGTADSAGDGSTGGDASEEGDGGTTGDDDTSGDDDSGDTGGESGVGESDDDDAEDSEDGGDSSDAGETEDGGESDDSGADGSSDDGEDSGSSSDDGGSGESDDGGDDTPFSFFVTSLAIIRELSGSEDGFGGNFGGLEGADSICQQAAEAVGFGHKTWRAFLSTTTGGPNGEPVHARDRIGTGPWYDRNQRLIANDLDGLLQQRPDGDPQAVADLADEFGVPLSVLGDSHDTPTGSNSEGMLESTEPLSTCHDWTWAEDVPNNTVMGGHSWPRGSGTSDGAAHWIAAHTLRGCYPGVNLVQDGGGSGNCIGCSGGYGALYCFALTP